MNLKQINVIDLSTVLAGPSVGTFLAELGAKVTKIEHPKLPDVTRSWKQESEASTNTTSAYFSSINYKKSYLKLDLSDEKDHQEFIDKIKTADVLISNFKKGDDVKLNITDTALRKVNPKLIIAKITGFGLESDRVAYDLILQAESGFMSINGEKNAGPLKMPVALIDVLAAHQLKEAILLALLHRHTEGEAKTVHVSLYDAAVCSLTNQASNYLMTKNSPERLGNLHPNIAPYGEIFKTKNDKQITFAIGSDRHFIDLCTTLKLEIMDDPHFATNQLRVQNREKLETLIQQKVKHLNSDHLMNQLHHLNVPCALIKNINEVLDSNMSQYLIRSEIIDGEPTSRITSIGFNWTD
jgi:crotonobetainyl-CoA:carnitine CoA-transferase CaiB-like acyl-CoA transferase